MDEKEAIVIDRYDSSCAAEVARLSQEWADEQITLGYSRENAWTVEQLTRPIFNGEPLFLIAKIGEKVVGYVRGEIKLDDAQPAIPAGERYLKVRELYIDKTKRSAGIGRQLMKTVHEKAGEMGVYRAQLKSANTDSRTIQEFYESLGYRVWYVQMYK
jgi:GNAT superfamily N-acetyltransferase